MLHGILRHYMVIEETILYACAMLHAQWSGAGTSRTYDELVKRIFYISLNFAGPYATSTHRAHCLPVPLACSRRFF